MISVQALSNISHDGEEYKAGQTLEVTAEQAEALIEAGAASKGRQAKEGEVIEDQDDVVTDGLDKLGFKDLQELATTEGVDIAELKSKDALREAIRAKRA